MVISIHIVVSWLIIFCYICTFWFFA